MSFKSIVLASFNLRKDGFEPDRYQKLRVNFEASKTGSDHASNWFVLKFTSLACLGGAGFLNVKRSTPGFGIWFTFLQVIAAIGIIAPIILIIAHFRSKDALSQSFR